MKANSLDPECDANAFIKSSLELEPFKISIRHYSMDYVRKIEDHSNLKLASKIWENMIQFHVSYKQVNESTFWHLYMSKDQENKLKNLKQAAR